MKNIAKQIVIAAALIVAISPAFAGERPTKGTKSYQTSSKSEVKTEQTAEAKTDADVQNIAPAAGDTTVEPSKGKTMKEEIRLPRKN